MESKARHKFGTNKMAAGFAFMRSLARAKLPQYEITECAVLRVHVAQVTEWPKTAWAWKTQQSKIINIKLQLPSTSPLIKGYSRSIVVTSYHKLGAFTIMPIHPEAQAAAAMLTSLLEQLVRSWHFSKVKESSPSSCSPGYLTLASLLIASLTRGDKQGRDPEQQTLPNASLIEYKTKASYAAATEIPLCALSD